MRPSGWLPIPLLLTLAALAAAQQPAQAPYVDALPGMGRPVDIPAAAARRERLMRHLGEAVVLVPAAHQRDIEGVDYPQDNDFRQSNTFFYLSMLEQQDAWIVLNARAGGPGESVLLLPERNPMRERWNGVRIGPGEEAARLTGFPVVLGTRSLDSVVAAALRRRVPVFTPLDATARGDALALLARVRWACGSRTTCW